MTGEITLRGEILPIGGLKEKLLAANRAGIKLVIIPQENAKELQEIRESVRVSLDIRPVKWIDEVIELSLESVPAPITDPTVNEPIIGDKEKDHQTTEHQPGITAH